MATAAKSTWNDCRALCLKIPSFQEDGLGPPAKEADQAYADAQRMTHSNELCPALVYELLTMLHNLG
jgi:hypothetical protein